MLANLLSVGKLNSLLLWAVLLVIVVVSAIILFAWQRVTLRHYADELTTMTEIVRGLRSTSKLEDNLSLVLSVISKMIEAPYLAFYVQDTRSKRYILRVVSHPYDGFVGVGPSYSGLALPKRESQLPPMAIDQEYTFGRGVALVRDGEVPLLLLRTRGQYCLIRIGPVDKVTKRTRKLLRTFLHRVEGLLDDLVHLEVERMRHEVTEIADTAVKNVAALAIDTEAAIEIIVRAFAGMSGGIGGVFLQDPTQVVSHWVYSVGKVSDVAAMLEHNPDLYFVIEALLSERPYYLVARNDEAFYDLPDALTDIDVGAIAIIRVRGRGVLLFFYDSEFVPEDFLDQGMRSVRILYEQLNRASIHYSAQKKLSAAYARLLMEMIDMVDNLNPYTVGYSEMAMRYSLVIGHKMGLAKDELMDLALAAHLSNIGVIGLDMELLVKEGKYTDFEYESMKLHCEIGASMIKVATGNQRAASYVLYHHERMDGLGYPSGLKGQDIPIGARILYVVQMFLAKVSGRTWRDPLSFDKALDELRKASGTQLDPEVVQAFFSWVKERQQKPEVKGKSLGRCYEMCCVPKSICESCPVYLQPNVNCWEVGNNNCVAHGKECSTCFVRTEYMNREQLGYIMEQRKWQGEFMR